LRRELFGSRAAVGATIRFKQVCCEVICVPDERSQGAFGKRLGDVIMMPLHTTRSGASMAALHGQKQVFGVAVGIFICLSRQCLINTTLTHR